MNRKIQRKMERKMEWKMGKKEMRFSFEGSILPDRVS